MGSDSLSQTGGGSGSVCQTGGALSQPLSEDEVAETSSAKGGGADGKASAPSLSLLAKSGELLIRGYQCVSRYTPAVCKFHPTCSEYTRQAIVRHGFWRGCFLGAWRILRCNPFSRGGYDPVPETFNLKSKWW